MMIHLSALCCENKAFDQWESPTSYCVPLFLMSCYYIFYIKLYRLDLKKIILKLNHF